ncbi:hypothetical protein [Streptomyces sp. GC420]|uniref:hypothetical protein n=1 Tax=Streptomyces sp. GC420 TaxID=2697568 RepID=UPI001FB6ECFC|nr:hypothetical protein [Streptomyces sp. GC420]
MHWRASVPACRISARPRTRHTAHGWERSPGNTAPGVAARRKALHAAELAAYREALERLSEHRSKAVLIVRETAARY